MTDFFKDNDRMKDRHSKRTKEDKQKIFALRAMMWRAIDENDKNFSIVETSKALGIK